MEKLLEVRKLVLARFDQRIGSILGDMSCVARFYTIDKDFARTLEICPVDWLYLLPVNKVGDRCGTPAESATDFGSVRC